jgi:exosortase/archaeosortase family protein
MVSKQNLAEWWHRLRPLRGVVGFVVTMLLANWFWKLFVYDGPYDPNVTIFGLDITLPFRLLQKEVVRISGLVFELCGIPFALHQGTVFEFANHYSTEIVWGCTGIKQGFIFTCIIATSRGPWKHKGWYIVAGLIAIHLINVIRISLVGIILNYSPSHFDLAHGYFFKYIFYLFIFFFWVGWEEYFFKKEMKERDHFL